MIWHIGHRHMYDSNMTQVRHANNFKLPSMKLYMFMRGIEFNMYK